MYIEEGKGKEGLMWGFGQIELWKGRKRVDMGFDNGILEWIEFVMMMMIMFKGGGKRKGVRIHEYNSLGTCETGKVSWAWDHGNGMRWDEKK